MKSVDEFVNKIICGDNVSVLKEVPDETYDLVVTSPPYDNIRSNDDYKETFDFPGLACELTRTLKKGGVIVWVVGDATIKGSETLTSFRQALHFKDVCGLNVHDTMIYQKRTLAFPDFARYYQSFEYMFVFSKGEPKTFNPLKDRKNKTAGQIVHGTERNKDGSKSVKSCIGNVTEEYGCRFNIWDYGTGKGKGNSSPDDIAFNHPAIFPEGLAEDHIKSWSKEGDFVLDPFGGAGTTAKMSLMNKRKFTSIEISQNYCDIQQKRIKPYLRNMMIFEGVI